MILTLAAEGTKKIRHYEDIRCIVPLFPFQDEEADGRISH